MDFFNSLLNGGDPGQISNDLTGAFLVFIKFLYVLAAILYVLFAIVMVRQVKVMGQTLTTNFSPVLRLLALLHLGAALLVLFYFATTL